MIFDGHRIDSRMSFFLNRLLSVVRSGPDVGAELAEPVARGTELVEEGLPLRGLRHLIGQRGDERGQQCLARRVGGGLLCAGPALRRLALKRHGDDQEARRNGA